MLLSNKHYLVNHVTLWCCR